MMHRLMVLFAVTVLGVGCTSASSAQSAEIKLKLGLEDAPRVGRTAPALTLPYATAAGIASPSSSRWITPALSAGDPPPAL